MKRVKFNKLIGILTLFGMISTSISLNFKEVVENTKQEDKNKNEYVKLQLNLNISDKENIDDNFYDKFIKRLETQKIKFEKYDKSKIFPIIWIFINKSKLEETIKKLNENNYEFNIVKKINVESQSLNWLDKKNQNRYVVPYYQFILNTKNKNFLNIPSIYKDYNDNYKNKVGILEYYSSDEKEGKEFIVDNLRNSLNVNKSIEPRIKEHGVLVSEILGGENGIHKNSNIYFSNFKDSQEWMKALEWLVLKNNVKIINHSYGFTGDESLYQEKSYYLDYLSRKYGVINVFSSGNGEWNPKTLNEWINERKLAFNSIIVGALNDSNTNISYYSNWRVYEKYEDISKPFVLAPGTYSYYNNKLLNELGHWRTEYKVKKDIYVNGTSFSAPAVSGAISLFLFLEENNKINNDKDRVQSIKSIIAASSTELKIGKTKLSGFDSKSGSGILNFERMLKAKENLKNITIAKDEGNKTFVYTSEKFKLKKENKISIALSWLFNSGILKTPEWKKDFDVNIHGNYPISLVKNVPHPKETHENENKLTLKETFHRLGNKFFSDYDLYLQKENKDGKWEDIKISNSSTSNDELIRYTAENEGVYRIAIYKYSDSYQNSVDDNLALSYIID